MSSPNVIIRGFYYGTESKNKEIAWKRNFYSSQSSSSDYMHYIDNGVKAGVVQDYMDYAGNREKSSGVFSRNGLLTSTDKKEIRKKLKNTR